MCCLLLFKLAEMVKPNDIDQGVHDLTHSKLDELRRINSGEISQEEFEKLD